MAGRRFIYGGASGDGSNFNSVLLQTQRPPASSPLNSLFRLGSSPFLSGSRSMVSFEDVSVGKRSSGSFFQSYDLDENGDEDFDDYFHQPEKKRRLKVDQVRFLEKSFEEENKLEPERKVQLAKDLGLQPRQVAIWFQNRRARWKNKQLEKDYDMLQDSYNSLKANYESLLEEKEKLKAEVVNLTDKLLVRENGNSESFSTKIPSEEALSQEQSADLAHEEKVLKLSILELPQDDNAAANSDVFDPDSPHYTDGPHSPLLERVDSSYVIEPEQSDVSQDEEDSFLPPLPYTFPKLEDGNYPSTDPPANTCYFGYPGDDQAFGFWSF